MLSRLWPLLFIRRVGLLPSSTRPVDATIRRAMTSSSSSSPPSNRIMSPFLSQSDAAALDQDLFAAGFSLDQLMELAGLACALAARQLYQPSSVLVLCGPGNNGGDGLGFRPKVVYPRPGKAPIMQALEKQMSSFEIPVLGGLPADWEQEPLIVDALFGFSFKPPVRDPFTDILRKLHATKVPVFSIDIPSGWDVEKGAPSDSDLFVKPNAVISLTAPKECMRDWTDGVHFVGGRFVPDFLAQKYNLQLPTYRDAELIAKL